MKKIYFFNGWGMDENILTHVLNTSEYELEIINFPYHVDLDEIKKCQSVIFIAWSFGVYYLNKFLNENRNLAYEKAIAINGMIETIGEYGINKKIFDMTLNTLSLENLLKFYRNMDIDENFKESNKKFEDIKKELKYFKDNYSLFENKLDYHIIGKYDRIIPSMKQEKYCKEKNISYKILDCGHYPFSILNDFSYIIDTKKNEE